jgi:hypothetical protein
VLATSPEADTSQATFRKGDVVNLKLRYRIRGIDSAEPRELGLILQDEAGKRYEFLSTRKALDRSNGTFSAEVGSEIPKDLPAGTYTLISTLRAGDKADHQTVKFEVK